eukprot:m51a1_g11626 hypothetical protein (76) ;mRNA; r:41096-41323
MSKKLVDDDCAGAAAERTSSLEGRRGSAPRGLPLPLLGAAAKNDDDDDDEAEGAAEDESAISTPFCSALRACSLK